VRHEAGSPCRVLVSKPNPSRRTAEIRRPSRTQRLFDRTTSHFVAGKYPWSLRDFAQGGGPNFSAERGGGHAEVDQEGGEVGQGEAHGAGGDFGVELEAVQHGGHGQSDETRQQHGERDAATDDEGGGELAAP